MAPLKRYLNSKAGHVDALCQSHYQGNEISAKDIGSWKNNVKDLDSVKNKKDSFLDDLLWNRKRHYRSNVSFVIANKKRLML